MRPPVGRNTSPWRNSNFFAWHIERCALAKPHRFSLRHATSLSFPALDQKWRKRWAHEGRGSRHADSKAKTYILAMFPYPSGALHMGHVRVYTIADVLARCHRMQGHRSGRSVIHPMGWDAFGLPAENAAIERGLDPAEWTKSNIAKMKEQLQHMNTDIDWSRELVTCNPEFYAHTQRIFLLLHEHGLAYQAESVVNFDPVDRTVLANEQVDSNGYSWRSGAKVEKVSLKQWFLKITAFQKELLEDLQLLDKWPEKVISMQQNWLGRSRGTRLTFDVSSAIEDAPTSISVFTTRLDTLPGVQFLALSPLHPLVTKSAKRDPNLRAFLDDLPRLEEGSKAGYEIKDVTAWNPLRQVSGAPALTREALSIWVAPYVKAEYGEGAIMGVPAHDERDHAFWKTNRASELIRTVVQDVNNEGAVMPQSEDKLFKGYGQLTKDCGIYAGLPSEAAAQQIHYDLDKTGVDISERETWRLRDWLISRQRYWGTPIPIIHCNSCGPVPVPKSALPVELPKLDYTNFGRGKGNPLEQAEDWVNTQCPKCRQPARRDTDTMDTFVDSSWYMFRFADPHNDQIPFTSYKADAIMPVDIYVGGIEHAILHLLYARFIAKFLVKAGLWPAGTAQELRGEPFKQLISQGMVHGKTFRNPETGQFLKPDDLDWSRSAQQPFIKGSEMQPLVSFEKMSKSKHNGVDPTAFIAEYGADVTRVHMLFQAPVSEVLEWEEARIVGVQRWLTRLHKFVESMASRLATDAVSSNANMPPYAGSSNPFPEHLDISSLSADHAQLYLQTQRTTTSITNALSDTLSLNTCISDLMQLTNALLSTAEPIPIVLCHHTTNTLLRLLGPFAPAFAEECWEILHESIPNQQRGSLFQQPWPVADDMLELEEWAKQNLRVPCAVMENGKLRFVVDVEPVPSDSSEDEGHAWFVEQIRRSEKGRTWLENKKAAGVEWKRVIVAKSGKTVNFVGAPTKM